MHTTITIHGLRLLIREPAILRDGKGHDPLRVRHDRLYSFYSFTSFTIFQASHDTSSSVPPRPAQVVTVRIAEIIVILGAVRPRLRLVLGVRRVVPAQVPHEAAVGPGEVETAEAVVEAVDVRIGVYTRQVLAGEGVASR